MATDAQKAMLHRIAPQFSADPERDAWIDDAVLDLNRSTYGTRYDRAVALWAAHHLERKRMAKAGLAGVGAVTAQSSSTGSSSVTFSATQDEMATTSYGMQLIALRSRVTTLGPSIVDGRRTW